MEAILATDVYYWIDQGDISKMSQETIKQLIQYGYKVDLESMLNGLPERIWVTVHAKSIKRLEVSFAIIRLNGKWNVSLSSESEDQRDVYVLHRTIDKEITSAVAKMILFLEDNKMLGANI